MEKLAQVEYDFVAETNAIANIRCATLEEFDKESKKALKAAQQSRPNPKDSQHYNKFVKDLEDLQFVAKEKEAPKSNATDLAIGEDLMVQDEDFQPKIDPISKNPIRDPVRNVVCNHIYDKETIEEALVLNPRLR
jgi:E3 SUMO-protein ligase NSE2